MILKTILGGITLWFFYYIITNIPPKVLKFIFIALIVLFGVWYAVHELKKRNKY